MGMYKPIQYINFTFASNLPRKKYFFTLSFIGVFFFGLALSIYLDKMLTHYGITHLESRNFYSTGTSEYKLTPNYYDNLRHENERVEAVSIQSDVVEGAFLKLYINYSKVFDVDLVKICKEPTFSDSLKKYKRRLLVDKNRLECFNQYFKIALNDSTFDSVELFFEDQGNTKGLRTYLSTEKCKIGRNTLYVKTMNVDSLPKKVWTDYVAVPFWYAKDWGGEFRLWKS